MHMRLLTTERLKRSRSDKKAIIEKTMSRGSRLRSGAGPCADHDARIVSGDELSSDDVRAPALGIIDTEADRTLASGTASPRSADTAAAPTVAVAVAAAAAGRATGEEASACLRGEVNGDMRRGDVLSPATAATHEPPPSGDGGKGLLSGGLGRPLGVPSSSCFATAAEEAAPYDPSPLLTTGVAAATGEAGTVASFFCSSLPFLSASPASLASAHMRQGLTQSRDANAKQNTAKSDKKSARLQERECGFQHASHSHGSGRMHVPLPSEHAKGLAWWLFFMAQTRTAAAHSQAGRHVSAVAGGRDAADDDGGAARDGQGH